MTQSPPERRRTLLAAERATESLSRHGRTRVALGFPNSYEIGMSNLGFQWVYRLFNREDDVACDRFFVEDDGDLRGPRTLETDTPLGDFPLVAFSISWEMDYVNFLRLLPAARIPLERAERGEGDPIVLVGGDCARINPAPLARWVDVFAMGDGEKIVPAIAEILRRDLSRDGTIAALADVKGLYVPAVHGAHAEGADEGKIVVQQFKAGEGPLREPPHTTILTPHTELSDKLLIEIARGCSEMCRFCWAAYAMAPQVRVSAENVLEVARRNRPLTGRVGLIATAVADHPEILPILRGLAGARVPHRPLVREDRRDLRGDPRDPHGAGRARARDRARGRQRAPPPRDQQEGLRRDAVRQGAPRRALGHHAAEALPAGRAARRDGRGRRRHRPARGRAARGLPRGGARCAGASGRSSRP